MTGGTVAVVTGGCVSGGLVGSGAVAAVTGMVEGGVMTTVVGAGVAAGVVSGFWVGVFATSPSGAGAGTGRRASTYRVFAICTHTYGPTFCPHWLAAQTPPNFGGAAANDADTEHVSTEVAETMPATVLIRVFLMGPSASKMFGDSEIANLPQNLQKDLGNVHPFGAMTLLRRNTDTLRNGAERFTDPLDAGP